MRAPKTSLIFLSKTAVTLTENASLDDFYEPPTNHFTGYISAFTDEENYFHLDRVQLLTAGKTEARVHPVSGKTTVSNEPGNVTIYNPYVEADYMETDDKTVYYLHATENGSTSIFSGSAGTLTDSGMYKTVTRTEFREYLDSFGEDAENRPLFDIETKRGYVTEIRQSSGM